MRKPTRTLVSLLLCFCLCLNLGGGIWGSASGVLTLRAFAEEAFGEDSDPSNEEALLETLSAEPTADEMKQALDNIKNAMDALNLEGKSSFMQAFTTFISVAGYASTILAVINGSTAFLRLLGLVDDPTVSGIKSIMNSMELVKADLAAIKEKLDGLTNEMTRLESRVEFFARGTNAQNYEATWQNFYDKTVTDETGLNGLVATYNAMLKQGIRDWCRGNRDFGYIDNTELYLLYEKDGEGKWMLKPSISEGLPREYRKYVESGDTDHAYIYLPRECLPNRITFDPDYYVEDISDGITQAVWKNISDLECWNREISEYSEVKAIAADAETQLFHRIAAAMMSSGSAYATLPAQVTTAFKSYCSKVLTAKNGIDAIYLSLMLTHGFEGEISESMEKINDQLVTITGIYGPFVVSVMEQDGISTKEEKAAAASLWVNTINKLKNHLNNSLKGDPQYSPVMGGIVSTIKLNQEINIWCDYHRSKSRFDRRGTTAFTMYPEGGKAGDPCPNANKVSFALLTQYFETSGYLPKPDEKEKTVADGFKEYLDQGTGKNWYDTDDNTIIINSTGPIGYNTAGDQPALYTHLGLTNSYWWKEGQICSLRDLPDKASRSNINNNQLIKGNVFDMNSVGQVPTEQIIMAAAIYGEGHGTWIVDEIYLFATKLDKLETKLETSPADSDDNRNSLITTGDRCGLRVVTAPPTVLPVGETSSLDSLADVLAEIEEKLPKPDPDPTNTCFVNASVYDGYQEVGGIEVALSQNGQTIQTAVTSPRGCCSFGELEPGEYQVSVTRGTTVTRTVTLEPDSGASAALGFNCNIVCDDPFRPFEGITAQGLPQDTALLAEWYVELEGTIVKDIAAAAGSAVLEFLGLYIEDENGDNVPEPAQLVEVNIPYHVDANKTYKVYRHHENKVEALTEKPNEKGEYIRVGADSITIYSKNFSVYAIASYAKGSPVKPDPEKEEDKPAVTPAPVARKSPQTGDSSTVMLFAALLGCCALLTAAGVKRREE